jgi:Domain of unknown function (DUF4349)
MKQLDPVVENDLNAIESALAEGRATATLAHDRELQELALLLESDVQRPDPDFAAELADLVHDGFPRERPSLASRLPRIPRPRVTLPVAGAVASAVLAVVVVVSLNDRDEDGPNLGRPLSAGGGAAEPAKPTLKSAGDSAAGATAPAPAQARREFAQPLRSLPLPPAGDRFAPGRRERRIERSASLTLAAPGDELDRVADRIVTVTDRHGGFVLRSSITSGDEGGEGGSFDLRIPADRLQPALRDLAALGEVRSRTQSGEDVTVEFVTAADRLQGARAERKSLLRRLENATTDTEAEALRRSLDLNAIEIRRLRSQLRTLSLRTNYARVSVALVEDGGSGDGGGSGGSGGSLDDALDDALNTLTDSIGIALRILGAAIPLALVGGLAWASLALWRRRRREAALS